MSYCSTCGNEATGAFCARCGNATPEYSDPEPSVATEQAAEEGRTPLAAPASSAWPPPPISQPATVTANEATVPPAPYAIWIRRVAGSLIDALVVGIPFVILLVAGLVWGLQTVHWSCHTISTSSAGSSSSSSSCVTTPGSHFGTGGIVLLVLAVLLLIGWYIYVVFAIGSERGATIGMRAMSLRCVREKSFDRLGGGWSFLRLLIAQVLKLLSIVNMLDLLWPLWDNKHQTLHDKAVRSVVLDLRP